MIEILNKKEKEEWMNLRMSRGFSFEYIKGFFNGERLNVGVKCLEDGAFLEFSWVKKEDSTQEE